MFLQTHNTIGCPLYSEKGQFSLCLTAYFSFADSSESVDLFIVNCVCNKQFIRNKKKKSVAGQKFYNSSY